MIKQHFLSLYRARQITGFSSFWKMESSLPALAVPRSSADLQTCARSTAGARSVGHQLLAKIQGPVYTGCK